MSQELWAGVDRYITDTVVKPDEALNAALRDAEAAGLPAISVSPPQGKLLHLLARLHGARNILEIGTLAGYSTIWLARALPAGGQLVTLEIDATHDEVARANLERAGLTTVVEQRLGSALKLLPQLAAEEREPFDLVFIDADKPSNPDYFDWALRLTRPGSLIIIDNVVRQGALADAESKDDRVHGSQRLHEMIAAESRVSATTIQTVGSKGYDGFTLALVLE
jgi:predicted O-methyltransferase YrrM